MGRMNVMTDAGDITVTWDPDDPAKVEQAKAEWDRLKSDGYEFFVPGEPKAKRVKRWDPTRAHVIAAPGVQSPAERKDPAMPRSRAMAGGPNAEPVTGDRYTRELDALQPHRLLNTAFAEWPGRARTGLIE